MKITLKLDENGHIVVDDSGRPVGVFEDASGSKEEAIDIPAMYSKITGLNKESAERRHKIKEYEAHFKSLEDSGVKVEELSDFLEQAKSNAQKVADLGDKDMKSIEEVEKIKRGVSESYESKLKELNSVIEQVKSSSTKELSNKEQVIRNLLIKGAFNKSEFIKDKTVLTPDIAFNTFGRSFRVEEDGNEEPKVYATDHLGEKIFSKTRPGEYADPEEAIELLIKSYPQAEAVLRSSQGGDSGQSFSSPKDKSKKFDAQQFANMSPTEKLKMAHQIEGSK